MQLKNKIVFITGANAGIGAAIVNILEKEKYTIIATSRKISKKNKKKYFLL